MKHYICLVGRFFVIAAAGIASANGQSNETLENTIPKHLPINVEIIYDEGPKVLENVKIKVTNTGKRPIYSLHLGVNTADESGLPVKHGVSRLYFGRRELMTFGNFANSEDLPLKQGEHVIFALAKRVQAFRKGMRDSEIKPNEFELFFQFLSFGDDTGFWTTGGVPFPSKRRPPDKKQTSLLIPSSGFSFFFNTKSSVVLKTARLIGFGDESHCNTAI